MARVPSLLFLPLFTLFFITSAPAQPRPSSYFQLDEDSGLAQNFVYEVLRDPKGFIWISTGKGITRYDGNETKSFTTQDGLAEDYTSSAYLPSTGGVLFGHLHGSISFYNGFYFEPILGDTLQSEVISIAEDADKNIWCATRISGLIHKNNDSDAITLVFPDELRGKPINTIKIIKEYLLVATNEGLYLFQIVDNTLLFHSIPKKLLSQDVTTLEAVKNNAFQCWVGTRDIGILRMELGDSTHIEEQFSFTSLENIGIKTICQDSDQSLWVGTAWQGVVHLTLGANYTVKNMTFFNESTGFPIRSTSSLLVDSGKRVWVGTSDNGVIRLPQDPLLFEYYDLSSNYRIKEINNITQGNYGYYLATRSGLFQFNMDSKRNNKPILAPLKTPFGEDAVLSTAYLDGYIWVGTQNQGLRICVEKNGTLENSSLLNPFFKTLRVRLLKPDTLNHVMWVSVIGQGVMKIDNTGTIVEHFSTATGFIHNDIMAIETDWEGGVWFGSLGAGLARLSPDGIWQKFSQKGIFPSHDVTGITKDLKGDIWVATDGQGYFRFDGIEFTKIGVSTEKASPYIKGISADTHHRIWTTTKKGISYFDIKSEKTRFFGKTEGLIEKENYSSPIFIDKQGYAFIFNENGIIRFHTNRVPPPLSLNTYLNEIQISFVYYKPPHPSKIQTAKNTYPFISLQHNQNHVTFKFLALDPSYLGSVYYRYFIEELESTWSPPSVNNTITYSSLPSGEYTLQVQATSDPGNWHNPILKYYFTVKKPYWEMGWFYIVQILGFIMLFGITYIATTQKSKSRQSASRIMIFTSLFIASDYIQNWFEVYTSDFIGSIPIYRTLFNFCLALILFPVERIVKNLLKGEKQLRSPISKIRSKT